MVPTFAIIGCGNRGAQTYGAWLRDHPEAGRVVAVVDADAQRRERTAGEHALAPGAVFVDAASFFAAGKLADVAIIATPDREHADQAVAALDLGYHLLLEKPIATNPADLERVAAAAARSGRDVTVAHVLRYAPLMRSVKRTLETGELGQPVHLLHEEHIGAYHYAHSYVRGNWHQLADSSPMLLAKACHDLDLLLWWVGAPVVRLASQGGLAHFRPENAPAGATERCLECPVADCPFDARAIYQTRFAGATGWPISVISPDPSPAGVTKALREGPYGRCVYLGENDVADHQSLLLEFANGVHATLVVSAFHPEVDRKLRFGFAHGELRAELRAGLLERRRHRDGALEVLPLDTPQDAAGHGGGDAALMADVCARAAARQAGRELPSPTALESAVASHRLAFAAEVARERGVSLSLDAQGRVTGGV
jgi:predicted dehydrogenase